MPRLIVIKGTDEGKQFNLQHEVVSAGRDSSSRLRLTDTEVSRRHAEFFHSPDGYRVRDVGSANGTFVNGQSIRDVLLQPGDHVQIGQTILVYTLNQGESLPQSDLANRISLISRQDLELSSAIIQSVGETEGSRIMAHPDQVEGPWLRNAQALGVLYEATQLITQTLDLNQLLERILDLVFKTMNADRGCILLKTSDESNDTPASASEFEPRAIRYRDADVQLDKFPVSRTIIDHVLRERKGLLVSDATRDERFQSVHSIVRSGIREVICVPMKGRHQTLGVLYLDTSTPSSLSLSGRSTGKFTGDHLKLAIAIAHQAALAVEETRYHQAMMNAERLAAVGQTVAALSHHIKNILHGLQFGGEMVEKGIREKDDPLLQQGWKLVSRNQGRIQELVKDMLSYSKEREPNLEPVFLNEIVSDVIELMTARAGEANVRLEPQLYPSLPLAHADAEGIHRALLNVVTNAIDAVEDVEDARIILATSRDGTWLRIQVIDNGPGIPEHKIKEVFRPFVSSKGSKGTGLGLAVSRKILREHGGDIFVQNLATGGCIFTLRLPMSSPLGDAQNTQYEIPVVPPPPD